MSRKRMIRIGIIVACVALVISGYIILSKWMNDPNEGTVSVGTSSSDTAPTSESTPLKTAYFTTMLPSDFTVRRQTDPAATALPLQLVANTPSATDQQIAITVDQLPTGGITEVGDYNLRATQTQTYTRFTPPNLPQGAVAFKNTSGPAGFTVFWAHGNHYAEISLSTDGIANMDQLETTSNQVMSAWQWL